MNKTAYEFDAPSKADADFLAGVRADRMALQKELDADRAIRPWQVAVSAFVSGTALAALLITAAYLTPGD